MNVHWTFSINNVIFETMFFFISYKIFSENLCQQLCFSQQLVFLTKLFLFKIFFIMLHHLEFIIYKFDQTYTVYINNQIMKIIDYEYVIPVLIVIVGIPLLLYLKEAKQPFQQIHITIYGSTIQTAMLAYYIDKSVEHIYKNQDRKYVNVTLVSPFQQNNQQKQSRETDKTFITFCGVQNNLMKMLVDLDLQYEINQYQIYFAKLEQGKDKQEDLEIYQIQQEYPIQSLLNYGLSHLTAKNIFQQFQSNLKTKSKNYCGDIQDTQTYLKQLSMETAIRQLFPYNIQESGIQYLSQEVGLDQQYIDDYIIPILRSSYLHDANSLTSMFKLLPLFCTNNKQLGSSLSVLEDQIQLFDKLLQKIQYLNVNRVFYNHLQQFQMIEKVTEQTKRQKQQQIKVTYLNTFVNPTNKQQQDQENEQIPYVTLNTNLLFIIQDYEMANKKEISYYRTLVDGRLKEDQKFTQFFTIYFKNTKSKSKDGDEEQDQKQSNYLYSATRICSKNCKAFNNNIYIVISKQKLSEKDLSMFTEHHIVYYKKYWVPKTQIPSQKRFQQTNGVYRVYDTQSISDSYQIKLNVFHQLSKVVLSKIQ